MQPLRGPESQANRHCELQFLDLRCGRAQAQSIIMKALAAMVRSALLLLVFTWTLSGNAEVPTNSGPQSVKSDDTNTQEMMRTYLQLQEQIHATQLAIEQTRKEAQEASAKNSEALAGRLHAIETALSGQRARELEAMQSSNRVMLFMAGTFAVVGFVAMLVMAYFQWRTVHGLAEISAVLPPLRALGPGSAMAALPAGDLASSGGSVDKANVQLLGALEQLEKRILDLERSSRPALEQGSQHDDGETRLKHEEAVNGTSNGHGKTADVAPKTAERQLPGNATDSGELKSLLEEGQKLLDEDQPEAALTAFDRALLLHPAHAETLVKKGVALEKMRKLPEAVACYDAAISADNSLTIAYLHKGGVFNRMERYNEALECYEKALRTQEKRGI